MSENQINVYCKNCNAVIYVGRELTVEEQQQSDTKDQIEYLEDLAAHIEADVKPLSDPLVDHLVSEIEMTIAEMEQHQESFNTSKKHLKELKKMVKHRVKAEMKAGKIISTL